MIIIILKDKSVLVMASVGHLFDDKMKSGHLILAYDAMIVDGIPHIFLNDSSPFSGKQYSISIEKFTKNYSGRSILVCGKL